MKQFILLILILSSGLGFYIAAWEKKQLPAIQSFNCISYDPNYKVAFDPKSPQQINSENIRKDLSFLAQYTNCIRIYTSRFGHEEVPKIAAEFGLEVVAGAWITDKDNYDNQSEVDTLIRLTNENSNIKRVIVGNEVIELELTSTKKLIEWIELVKAKTNAKVSTSIISSSFQYRFERIKEVFDTIDFVAIHILPYWHNIPGNKYVDWSVEQYRIVKEKIGNKPIFAAEIGYPSRGQANRFGDEMSRLLQGSSLRRTIEIFEKENVDYNVIGAFDQPWQRFEFGGIANVFYGIFTIYRHEKFPLAGPIPFFDIPQVTLWFHVIFVLTSFLFFRQKLNLTGQIYGVAGVHFIYISFNFILDYFLTSYPYLSFGQVFFAINLFVFLVLSLFHLMEFLFRFFRKIAFQSSVRIERKDFNVPIVLIPFTDEPIEILSRSVCSLISQDKKDFKAYLIANNTNRKDLDEVQSLIFEDDRFEFVHYPEVDGFKAGALNKAIREISIPYDCIFFLDCDYQVKPNWISHGLEKLCSTSDIIFYPQAYEKNNERIISKLISNEYSGYSKFSLPLRSKFNIGILHGAMLVVSREVFFKLNLLNERSITEDADFGIKAITNGHTIHYVEDNFGYGVFPANFKAYLNQRERWVIGACKVMQHRFLGVLNSNHLSVSRKIYLIFNWLPWVATLPYLIFVFYQLYYYDRILFRYHYMDGVYYFMPFPFLFIYMFTTHTLIKRYTLNISIREAILSCFSSLCLLRTISISIMKGFIPALKFKFIPTNKDKNIKQWTPIGFLFNFSVLTLCLYFAVRFFFYFEVYSFQIYLQFLIMFLIGLISFSELWVAYLYNRDINRKH